MFHVAPLLPGRESDPQRLDRKRHIGNDIVVILFQDDDAADKPFKVSSISSKQNHVFAFVRPHKDGYVVSVCNKDGVPVYTPELPEPAYFEKNAVSRDFFLHKRASIVI